MDTLWSPGLGESIVWSALLIPAEAYHGVIHSGYMDIYMVYGDYIATAKSDILYYFNFHLRYNG